MYFVKEFEVEPDKLLALTFEPSLEQSLIGRVKRSQFDIGLVMDPEITESILNELDPKIKEMTEKGLTPLIITTSELRLALRRFMEPSYPQLVILSYQELPTNSNRAIWSYCFASAESSAGGLQAMAQNPNQQPEIEGTAPIRA